MSETDGWRQARPDDLDLILAIQDEVHSLLPEGREVFARKMLLFAEGCLVLGRRDSNTLEHDVVRKPVPTFRHHALDHDVFGPYRSKDMNVIDSNTLEHDVVRKPVPTFRHHALGYGVAHPWRLGAVPPLDTLFPALPDAADCLFIHDVALMPEARGKGAGGAFVRRMRALARRRGFVRMALVSVYGTVPVWERCGFRVAAGTIPAEKLASYGDTARYMIAEVGDDPETRV